MQPLRREIGARRTVTMHAKKFTTCRVKRWEVHGALLPTASSTAEVAEVR